MSSGSLSKLQWKATHTRVYGQHKLYLMDLNGNTQSWVDTVEYGYGQSEGKYDHNILYELSVT